MEGCSITGIRTHDLLMMGQLDSFITLKPQNYILFGPRKNEKINLLRALEHCDLGSSSSSCSDREHHLSSDKDKLPVLNSIKPSVMPAIHSDNLPVVP